MEEFGERLKSEREQLGMSQAKIGKACGVTKLTQLRYERSKGSPSVGYWKTLHELGVDILYVITGEKLKS